MEKLDNSNITKHLGQTSEYKATYDNSLLVKEPRSNNRQHLLHVNNDSCIGYDLWNAYEVTYLSPTDLPVSRVCKIRYPSSSEYIVESKSIKLYLNSFNLTNVIGLSRFTPDNADASWMDEAVENIISKDLSELLETEVDVKLLSANTMHGSKEYDSFNPPYVGESIDSNPAITLEDCFPFTTIDAFEEDINLLQEYKKAESQNIIDLKDPESELKPGDVIRLHSAILYSRCRVTSQPDHGDVFIQMELGEKIPDLESVLKYIVSFRNECHFHEEICETIWDRLTEVFEPANVLVTCLYTRRGGIDINPVRSNNKDWIDALFASDQTLNLESRHCKTPKQ